MKTQKNFTSYSLQKLTNSVIKWTSILTFLCLDKIQ